MDRVFEFAKAVNDRCSILEKRIDLLSDEVKDLNRYVDRLEDAIFVLSLAAVAGVVLAILFGR